ncbi:MAG: A/G-specific adenine glycosylase [Phycisphaerales bacterium]
MTRGATGVLDRPAARTACASKPDPRAVEAWFRAAARRLPWRSEPRLPYHALVAEAMLQQTQVSRVVEHFGRFVGRFPSVESLAAAHEQEVLALWSGLGYYRRARSLHAAAKMIVTRFASLVPSEPEELLALPGVGKYTAGAIASIAFGRRAAIVDGNVQRVLMRVHGRETDPEAPATRRWVWREAQRLVDEADDPGAFNEGLMELGALVCVPAPAAPRCGECPWSACCRARQRGRERRIPRAKATRVPRTEYAGVLVCTRPGDGAVLLVRRGSEGMWAGMWQAPTLEDAAREPGEGRVAREAGVPDAARAAIRSVGAFTHRTTHRVLEFKVWHVDAAPADRGHERRWVLPGLLGGVALSAAQRRAIEMALAAARKRGAPGGPAINRSKGARPSARARRRRAT